MNGWLPPVSFLWPQMLWLLLALPLLVLLYLWLLSRRRKSAVRLASLSIVREAAGRGPGWRRHLPPVLLLLAVAASLLAASRPVATLRLPSTQQTIILAMDVSGSMRAEDVKPNRLVASQEAAKAFLTSLPRHVKVGIVAFAGSAQVVQPVTLSREDLVTAIDKFQLQRATAIGSAMDNSGRYAVAYAKDDVFLRRFAADGTPQGTSWISAGMIDLFQIAMVAVLYALFIVTRVLIFGVDTPGYASLLIADNHGINYLVRDMFHIDKHSRKILDRFL